MVSKILRPLSGSFERKARVKLQGLVNGEAYLHTQNTIYINI